MANNDTSPVVLKYVSLIPGICLKILLNSISCDSIEFPNNFNNETAAPCHLTCKYLHFLH